MQSVFRPLEQKPNSKSQELFYKLYPKWKGKKTWDVIREQTYPIKEIKPGGNANVTV